MPAAVRDEVVSLLRDLIRLDTVNPPGNETVAAELLRGYLEKNGVACELYARTPDRANLVARIPGQGTGPSLLLLSHTDTVLADPSEWSVDPWSGEVKDGCIWGRGALDMKGQVAASAVAVASLAREGFAPAGDLIFCATADEEVGEGEHAGLRWLCETHPDAVRCDYALNEGAGDRLELGGRVFYLCAPAEKMSAPFNLVVHGRSGHASLPGIADNALVKAAGLIERIAEFREPPQLGPETEALLLRLTGEAPSAESALDAARAVDRSGRGGGRAAADDDRLAPTQITASHKRNVIPGLCEVAIDCRLLSRADRRRTSTASSANGSGRETTSSSGVADRAARARRSTRRSGGRSRSSSRVWSPARPSCRSCVPGFTDSHWLREAFGTVAYGFFPMQGDGARSSRRGSSTRLTSEQRSRTSSSASTSCAMPRCRSALRS